jgi:hypothetical protein
VKNPLFCRWVMGGGAGSRNLGIALSRRGLAQIPANYPPSLPVL